MLGHDVGNGYVRPDSKVLNLLRSMGAMNQFKGIRRAYRLGVWHRELDDELEFHRHSVVSELVQAGMSKAEAEAEAASRFGNERKYRAELEAIDSHRARFRGLVYRWEVVTGTMAYAVRRLWKSPLFSVTVILTFALGIGVNVTMFSVLDRILLSPPPHIENPESIRRLFVEGVFPFSGVPETSGALAYPHIEDYAQVSAFSGVAAMSSAVLTIGVGAEARQVNADLVTGNFFELLGVRPALGRFFGPEEDQFGGAGLAVISYGTWVSDFGADPGVVGEAVDFGYGPYTVVGVAPEGFTGIDLRRVDFWLPLHVTGPQWRNGDRGCFETRSCRWLTGFARLAQGVSNDRAAEQAAAALRGDASKGTPGDFNMEAGSSGVLAPLILSRGPLASQESAVAIWVGGIALMVLLIACANVANLMIARMSRDRRDAAVRVALGGSRRRLAGQILAETLLLAAAGGMVAVFITSWGGSALNELLLPEVSWNGPNTRVLAFSCLVVALTGLLSGLLPSVYWGRLGLNEVLNAGGRSLSSSSGQTRGVLTALQAGLSAILLIGAGLFVRSSDRVGSMDLGIGTDRVLVVRPTFQAGVSFAQQDELYERSLNRVRALPGVLAASRELSIPFSTTVSWGIDLEDGRTLPENEFPVAHAVDEGYFRLMELEVRRGRSFRGEGADDNNVVLVSESFARLAWPGEEPLGKCMLIHNRRRDTGCAEVIGVVEDAKQHILGEGPGHYYVPYAQQMAEGIPNALLLKVSIERGMIDAINREILGVDDGIRYVQVNSLADLLSQETRSWRLGATLFGVFGLLALALATIGLYSTLSYTVAQRTFELGIRSALGANRRRLILAVVSSGMLQAVAGGVIGIAVAHLLAPRLEPFLFQVPPRDPATFLGVSAVLLVAALLAGYLPAARATRVDPAVALRAD